MKSLLNNFNSIRTKISDRHFVTKKKVIKWTAVLLAFAMMNLTFGCHNYFKVTSSARPTSETIAEMNDNGKAIIVHFNQKKWLLTHVEVKNNTVTARMNEYQMPPTFKPVKPGKPNRYIARPPQSQRYLLNEVHLYLDEFIESDNMKISIPVSSINKIEIYDKDTVPTVGSYLLGTLIYGAPYTLFPIIVWIFKIPVGLSGFQ
ncbi:MAG TPA: hypothetical protein DCR40_01085 [Prolixibacteraceae bacterium]|nr:hypothetical protein [Prolixibacteraceae bacterium]